METSLPAATSAHHPKGVRAAFPGPVYSELTDWRTDSGMSAHTAQRNLRR